MQIPTYIFQILTLLSFHMKLKFGWCREGQGTLLRDLWKFTSRGRGDQCVASKTMMLTQHADSLAILNHLMLTQAILSKS